MEVEAVLTTAHLLMSCLMSMMQPIMPSHLLHGRLIVSLPYYYVKDDEVGDPSYGEAADIQKRAKVHSKIFGTDGAGNT